VAPHHLLVLPLFSDPISIQAVTLIFVTRFMQALHMQLALDNFARIQNQTLLLPFGQLAPLEIKSRFQAVFRLHSSSAGFLGVALSPRALVMGQYFFLR
jgi:hypothetical protein